MNRDRIGALAMSLASLAVILAAGSAFALGMRGSMDPMETFEEADANHDGVITRDEYSAVRAAKFDKLDRNHDGFLNDADFPRLSKRGGDRADKLREMLQGMDTDHDGKVSRDEFVNSGSAIFNLVDANRDGQIDKSELQQAADRLKALR